MGRPVQGPVHDIYPPDNELKTVAAIVESMAIKRVLTHPGLQGRNQPPNGGFAVRC